MIFLILITFLEVCNGFSFGTRFLNKLTGNYNKKIKVGDYLIERLLEEGVDTCFGYNGGAALPFFDCIAQNDNFNIIVNRHEQSSGHCAEGYSKIKNNLGVVLTTSGPGFTNVITPLQDAYSDGIPLLCISGQVNSKTLGTDAFQECDAVGISRSCVKKSVLVKDTDNFIETVEELIKLAKSARKGPVHMDICKDIFTNELPLNKIISDMTVYEIQTRKKEKDLESNNFVSNMIELKSRINNSKRPVIIAGAGCKNSYLKLRDFSKRYKIPVATTLHGLGVMDELDDLSLNMIGMHGTYEANRAVTRADLIIGIGNRFDDRTIGKLDEFGKNAKNGIIHIDNSKKQIDKIGKIIKPDMSIHSEVEDIFDFFNRYYNDNLDRSRWLNEINLYRNMFSLNDTGLTSNKIISSLSKYLEENDNYIITTGVGSHQMVVAQYFNHRYPNRLLTSGSLGTMGVGLPFAIGAQIANPNSTVILIDGDGSFTMSSNDLATLKEYNLPIKIFLMNDKKLNMVDMWQDLFYEGRKIASNFGYDISYNKLMDAYDIKNSKIDKISDIDEVVKQALEYDGTTFVNCQIDKSICLPFVPNNTPLDKMILH